MTLRGNLLSLIELIEGEPAWLKDRNPTLLKGPPEQQLFVHTRYFSS